MALVLAAERRSTIGLGPGVLVPSLRLPVTNAAAIATLAALAPSRVAVALGGSGFTGRYIVGKCSLRQAFVEEYVTALRGLLRGETVQWEDAPARMLHTGGFVADRSVDVEVLIGADGPKVTAVAERIGDWVFAAGCRIRPPRAARTPCCNSAPCSTRARTCTARGCWIGQAMASPSCFTRCTNATAPALYAACPAAMRGCPRSRPSRPPNAIWYS